MFYFLNSIGPDHGLDLPNDLGLIAVDGVIGRIFRQEPDLLAVFAEALDRCGVSEQRNDDLTVVRRRLGTDDDSVPVEDSRADHGITADAQREAARFSVPRQIAFNIFNCQNR